MFISTSLRIALNALKANKMRSLLTMLGIIIGVAAVVIMVAIGSGASAKITAQIESVGSNLLIVVPGATTAGGVRMGSGTVSTLTLADAEAIVQNCPSVARVAPVWGGVAQAVYGNQNWSTGVTGTTSSMFAIRDWTLTAGRFFTVQETKAAAKVALLGQTVVNNLFGATDPIGEIVRIKKMPMQVIGVLAVKGQSPRGDDQDDAIYVPITTAQKRLFGTHLPGLVRVIMVQAKDMNVMAKTEKEITDLLDQRHRIVKGADRDFSVRNLSEILAAAQAAYKTMSLLLGSIALVSLIVGGIGIMNIMLVSVTERTREIGIRMAVGAQESDILTQFLIESLVLSLVGGVIGVILGLTGAEIMAAMSDWPVLISWQALLLAFAFSAMVGIFFGFYPARKAAHLNPIDALRYE
ncbi:MAG: FtsX-like permease family protein [Deltaproteobacteria bacterium]|nr:MAG: FtsX-like permease family protein [Deltaproteobacteria bacterium]